MEKSKALVVSMLVSGAAGVLVGCGGGSGSAKDQTPAAPDLTAVFPTGLAVASPLASDTSYTVAAAHNEMPAWLAALIPSAHAAGTPTSTTALQGSLQRINALLNGASPSAALMDPNRLLALESDAACYGPTLKYQDYYDATGTLRHGGNGELPSGDRGIWFDTDSATGNACAAAQLNSRMQGATQRSGTALRLLALLARAASGSLPAAGATATVTASMPAITGLTWNLATLAQPTAGHYEYRIQATYVSGGNTYLVEVALNHVPGASRTEYSGLLKYAVTNKFIGGNCPAGPAQHDVTNVGTVKYSRGGTALQLSHRTGQYCGAQTSHGNLAVNRGATYASDGQLDPGSKLDGATGKGWGNNFSRFAAELNTGTEAGNYIYAWQAGPQDGSARTLQTRLETVELAATTATAATAHFGYGADIASASSGPILGMVCNWASPVAVPGYGPTRNEFAQKQVMAYSPSTTLWTATSSRTRYAPTETCTYTAAAPKWYDRNDDDSFVGTVQVNATDADFLIDKGTAASLAAAIGFTVPSSY